MKKLLMRIFASLLIMGMLVCENADAVYATIPSAVPAVIEGEVEMDDEAELPEKDIKPQSDSEGTVTNGLFSEYPGSGQKELWSADVPRNTFAFEEDMHLMGETLPSSYMSPYCSSVKDQEPFGTCWAFTAMANAETSYLREQAEKGLSPVDDYDASEIHLTNFFYDTGKNMSMADKPETKLINGDGTYAIYGTKLSSGGNNLASAFSLARWIGASDETYDESLKYDNYRNMPYNYELNLNSNLAYKDKMHLENAAFINMSDLNGVKEAVMANGAVGIMYSDWSNFYDENLKAYYQSPFYYRYAGWNGHLVTIVGWDDNFDFSSFEMVQTDGLWGTERPNQKGAWRCKNSWGEEQRDDGYFWMSYYEGSLNSYYLTGTGVMFDFTSGDNYDHNYQYDGSSTYYTYYYCENDEIKGAAVYDAYSDQTLEAVSVAIASTNANVKVDIYTDITDKNNPESGDLVTTSTTEKPFSFQGIYTIPLKEKVYLREGESFAVVVTVSSEGNSFNSLFASTSSTNFAKFVEKTAPCQTFIDYGEGWRDANKDKFSVRIKAFTNDVDPNDAIYQHDKRIDNSEVLEIPDMIYTSDIEEMRQRIKGALHVYSDAEEISSDKYLFCFVKKNAGGDYEVIDSDSSADDINAFLLPGVHTIRIFGTNGSELDDTGYIYKDFNIVKKQLSAKMVTTDKILKYNGNDLTDKVKLVDPDTNTELKDDWYTIDFGKKGFTDAAKYTLTISATQDSPYVGKNIQATVTIEKADLNDENIEIKVNCTDSEYTYDGTQKKPSITITNKDTGKVIDASDYSVSYKNNINASGENAGSSAPTVIVKGKKNFKGTKDVCFIINRYSPTYEEITYTVKPMVYTGKVITPNFTVKLKNKTLVSGKDYEVRDGSKLPTDDASEVLAPVNAGDYSFYIILKGNYDKIFDDGSGTPIPITVSPAKINTGKVTATLDLTNKKVNAYYDNSLLEPDKYTYVLEDAQVKNTTEVDIANVEAGHKYNLKLNVNLGNYAGEKVFKNICAVDEINSENAEIRISGTYTYTGGAIKPKFDVYLKDNNIKLATSDYTAALSNNINAGDGNITIIGKGKYSGSISTTFTIKPKGVLKSAALTSYKTVYTNAEVSTSGVKVSGLKATEYTVNVQGGPLKDAKSYTGTITLSNNFRFVDNKNDDTTTAPTSLNFNYIIEPATISTLKVNGDGYYLGETDSIKPSVTVKAGKIDVSPDDFTVSYENWNSISTRTNQAKATITLKSNNYRFKDGKATNAVNYNVVKYNLSKLKWEIGAVSGPSVQYSGRPCDGNIKIELTIPGQGDSKTVYSTEPTGYGEKFDFSFKNNINAGKATCIIKAGTSEYFTGSVSLSFMITQAEIAEIFDFDSVREYLNDYSKEYSGKAQTMSSADIKKIVIKSKDSGSGEIVIPNSEFTFSYRNNINAGVAYLIIKSKKNCTGEMEIPFKITPKSINDLRISGKRTVYVDETEWENEGYKPIKTDITVKSGILKSLKEGKDYVVTYYNNKSFGTATATVHVIGNYSGSKTLYYNIKKK